MSRIVDVTVEALNLPLESAFETSLGVEETASNVLVAVETESGTVGYGDASPFPPVTGETQAGTIATATAAAELIGGESVADYRRLVTELRRTFPGAVSSSFALETAILDAYCKEREIALAELFGGPARPVVTDLTIPICPAKVARERATDAVGAGFEHLKIKTGNDVDEDVARVVAVREGAPDAELKVDANQGWTPKETARFAREVRTAGVDLALIEQPVAHDDVRGLARIRDRIDVPIAADETVFTPEDAMRVVREEAADVINVKLAKSGPLAAAEIVAIARAANLELMIGCMLETAIGIHTAAHVVAGTGAFSYVDLDANLLLAEDVAPPQEGSLLEIGGPGHGIEPSY